MAEISESNTTPHTIVYPLANWLKARHKIPQRLISPWTRKYFDPNNPSIHNRALQQRPVTMMTRNLQRMPIMRTMRYATNLIQSIEQMPRLQQVRGTHAKAENAALSPLPLAAMGYGIAGEQGATAADDKSWLKNAPSFAELDRVRSGSEPHFIRAQHKAEEEARVEEKQPAPQKTLPPEVVAAIEQSLEKGKRIRRVTHQEFTPEPPGLTEPPRPAIRPKDLRRVQVGPPQAKAPQVQRMTEEIPAPLRPTQTPAPPQTVPTTVAPQAVVQRTTNKDETEADSPKVSPARHGTAVMLTANRTDAPPSSTTPAPQIQRTTQELPGIAESRAIVVPDEPTIETVVDAPLELATKARATQTQSENTPTSAPAAVNTTPSESSTPSNIPAPLESDAISGNEHNGTIENSKAVHAVESTPPTPQAPLMASATPPPTLQRTPQTDFTTPAPAHPIDTRADVASPQVPLAQRSTTLTPAPAPQIIDPVAPPVKQITPPPVTVAQATNITVPAAPTQPTTSATQLAALQRVPQTNVPPPVPAQATNTRDYPTPAQVPLAQRSPTRTPEVAGPNTPPPTPAHIPQADTTLMQPPPNPRSQPADEDHATERMERASTASITPEVAPPAMQRAAMRPAALAPSTPVVLPDENPKVQPRIDIAAPQAAPETSQAAPETSLAAPETSLAAPITTARPTTTATPSPPVIQRETALAPPIQKEITESPIAEGVLAERAPAPPTQPSEQPRTPPTQHLNPADVDTATPTLTAPVPESVASLKQPATIQTMPAPSTVAPIQHAEVQPALLPPPPLATASTEKSVRDQQTADTVQTAPETSAIEAPMQEITSLTTPQTSNETIRETPPHPITPAQNENINVPVVQPNLITPQNTALPTRTTPPVQSPVHIQRQVDMAAPDAGALNAGAQFHASPPLAPNISPQRDGKPAPEIEKGDYTNPTAQPILPVAPVTTESRTPPPSATTSPIDTHQPTLIQRAVDARPPETQTTPPQPARATTRTLATTESTEPAVARPALPTATQPSAVIQRESTINQKPATPAETLSTAQMQPLPPVAREAQTLAAPQEPPVTKAPAPSETPPGPQIKPSTETTPPSPTSLMPATRLAPNTTSRISATTEADPVLAPAVTSRGPASITVRTPASMPTTINRTTIRDDERELESPTEALAEALAEAPTGAMPMTIAPVQPTTTAAPPPIPQATKSASQTIVMPQVAPTSTTPPKATTPTPDTARPATNPRPQPEAAVRPLPPSMLQPPVARRSSTPAVRQTSEPEPTDTPLTPAPITPVPQVQTLADHTTAEAVPSASPRPRHADKTELDSATRTAISTPPADDATAKTIAHRSSEAIATSTPMPLVTPTQRTPAPRLQREFEASAEPQSHRLPTPETRQSDATVAPSHIEEIAPPITQRPTQIPPQRPAEQPTQPTPRVQPNAETPPPQATTVTQPVTTPRYLVRPIQRATMTPPTTAEPPPNTTATAATEDMPIQRVPRIPVSPETTPAHPLQLEYSRPAPPSEHGTPEQAPPTVKAELPSHKPAQPADTTPEREASERRIQPTGDVNATPAIPQKPAPVQHPTPPQPTHMNLPLPIIRPIIQRTPQAPAPAQQKATRALHQPPIVKVPALATRTPNITGRTTTQSHKKPAATSTAVAPRRTQPPIASVPTIQRKPDETTANVPPQETQTTAPPEKEPTAPSPKEKPDTAAPTESDGTNLDRLARQIHPLVQQMLLEAAATTSNVENQQTISGVDLDILAQRVYPVVKRMLAIDLERLSRV